MSLIGSLEDLGLGDILQIINLSRKSGVLFIRGSIGEGRVVFQGGMVRAASLKGGPENLRGMLVDQGFASDQEYSNALTHAKVQGVGMDEALCACASLTSERLESLRRELVETSVGQMFSWTEGEFSFDVGGEDEYLESDLVLAIGVNAEYLAMESLRQSDEEGRDEGQSEDQRDGPSSLNLDMPAEEMFGVVSDPEASIDEDDAPMVQDAIDDVPAIEPEPAAPESVKASALDTLVEVSAMSVDHGMEDLAESELLETRVEHDDGEPLELAEIVEDGPHQASEPEDAEVLEMAEFVVEEDVRSAGDLLDAEPEEAEAEFEDALEAQVEEADEAVCVAPIEVPIEEIRASDAAQVAVESAPSSEAGDENNDASSDESRSKDPTPVVVIDSDLQVLAWVRDVLASSFANVHVFQRSQEGLGRIRQYLARAEMPLLVVSPEIEGNPLSGIVDAQDFVTRLHKQVPRMSIVWLKNGSASEPSNIGQDSCPVALRPSASALAADSKGTSLEILGAELRDLLSSETSSQTSLKSGRAQPDAPITAGPTAEPSESAQESVAAEDFEFLKEITRALSEASSRGDVLPLVIRFAAEIFESVAMFMVRDDHVIGMAQVGFDAHGGPDDLEMRAIGLRTEENANFYRVIDQKAPIRFAPTSPEDQRMVDLLGGRAPEEVYLAPIVSGDQVVALLYGDAGMGTASERGTAVIEVALQHAGLALDRAVLERALAEIEDESS